MVEKWFYKSFVEPEYNTNLHYYFPLNTKQ